MTRTAAGTYTYSYTTASSAAAGTWESVFTTNVEAGKTIVSNDYWTVAASPAQVIIHGVTDTTTPTISADATITNEGSTGYEYQYEWCVVSNINNPCGGGDDVFHATAAKFINPGDDFNTTLTATVPAAGNYYFKVVAYFGIDSSGASRTFTATSAATGGTGGAGGSGASASTPVTTPTALPEAGSCMGADFNHDRIVNSVDFSILLAYWKTLAPFANKCVDINRDSVVNSVDFSILLSQWGTPGKAI
jgi:hypothetical protein